MAVLYIILKPKYNKETGISFIKKEDAENYCRKENKNIDPTDSDWIVWSIK